MAATKGTVLLVEDDPFISDMTRYAFIDAGFDVIAVAAGEEAASLAFSGVEFDAMFTDINLDGEMNGWELAEVMHEMLPSLPIVATSGSASREEIAARIEGMPFVSKPYRSADVIAMVERLIEEARLVAAPKLQTAVLFQRLSA